MASKLSQLVHVRHTTQRGGSVLVLDTGAIITPEAQAMLAALHSRSIGGIQSHLDVLAERGADKFMSTYYVGYGHKSIGDLGSATLFIEGVSMLAAKAIQDWALYNGQESSTRYIDFAEQPFIDPISTDESYTVLETWRSFYLHGVAELPEALKERYPRGNEESEKSYDKAINARAFDIMRAFLPAGAATNLAWHGPLRQFADKLMTLRHHPLTEVREIAETAEAAVLEAFPNSFSDKRYEATEEYNASWQRSYYFDDPKPVEFELCRDDIDRAQLAEYREVLANRPPKTELPKHLAECGSVQFRFLLDFGSFRDLQRHRAVVQRMPLLTTKHGFAQWHLDELTPALRKEASALIEKQAEAIRKLNTQPEIAQYYTAMGFNTTNRLTGSLPALVYLVELRATRFVHATLRKRAVQMAEILQKTYKKEGLVLHLDDEPDRFDVKRGEHDIEKR